MGQTRESWLQDFVDWAGKHIKGEEKDEARVVLDHLFRAFGQQGSLDIGGTPELRVRKAQGNGGGTSFADDVWSRFSPRKDLLAQLLALNLDIAKKEKAGESVTATGVPPSHGDAKKRVTEDCIEP